MNILQMEDLVKGMPDEMLMQEAQMPSGQIPQFLALSEVQRRKEMRDKFQAPPQATVADQILQSGIASAMPQQPPQGGMAPPQGPPMGAPQGPVMAYGGGMMPYTMADGGAVPSGLQELNDAMVSARYRRGQGFLESVAPNPMNSFQAAKDLPSRLQALQRMADTGPSPYEPGNYGYTQSESGFGNDPFRMGPSGFIQAGHQAEALDRAGAMALGNRYQDYLNRMTNPFAGTGSGIVRDERLGDQSLNLDDYGMGMAAGGYVPGTIFMQAGQQVDIYKLANLSPTDRERIARQYQRLGLNADFVLNPQTFDALPLDKRKQLFERLTANEAASPQSAASLPGNLEQYTGAYGRLQGTPDIRLLIEQGSPDQIKTAFAESIQAGDDQTASLIQRMAVGRGKADQGELLDIGKQLRLLRGQQQSELRASERSAAAERDRLAQQNRANYLLTGQEPPPAAATQVSATTTPPAATTGTAAAPAAGQAPTAAVGSAPASGTDLLSEMTSAIGPTYAAITALMPTGDGAEITQRLDAIRKLQEQQGSLAPDFSPFIQQIQQRGEESVKRYEQSIKDIEDRMKKERLGAVLTTLGANLMAGESALGLEKAGALAQQMGKETRQEIAAERRLMDAAREGASDKVLALQVQQVTSDTAAKRDVLKAKTDIEKLALETAMAQGTERRQANRDAVQLAVNLSTSTISRLKSLEEQNALNTRSFIAAMGDISTSVLKLLEGEVGLQPGEREKKYNEQMARQIRAFGSLFPAIDIDSVIGAFRQNTGGQSTTAGQSRPPLRDVGSNYKEG